MWADNHPHGLKFTRAVRMSISRRRENRLTAASIEAAVLIRIFPVA